MSEIIIKQLNDLTSSMNILGATIRSLTNATNVMVHIENNTTIIASLIYNTDVLNGNSPIFDTEYTVDGVVIRVQAGYLNTHTKIIKL